MQIILQKQVEKLGNAGDVKDVAAGYFRNFLFPQRLAQMATPVGLKTAEHIRARATQQETKDREAFQVLLDALQKEHIVMLRKATDEGHLFGSVSETDIAESFAAKGYKLDKKHISLEVHIKELGTYPVTLQFDESLKGSISITVEREPS